MIQEWNELIEFLAAVDYQNSAELPNADLAVLAGSSLPSLADTAGELLVKGTIQQLLITGGVGHGTEPMRRNFAAMDIHFPEDFSEAEMFGQYILDHYPVSAEQILLEKHSTNSGENALFARELIDSLGLTPKEVIIIVDPLLQKRMKATFETNWPAEVRFSNYVPLIPRIKQLEPSLIFENPIFDHGWERSYFISLILGEITRLFDDASGYGPNGKGFIKHVTVPESVMASYQRLLAQYGQEADRI